jgi:nitronate monooxygenase
MNNNVLLKLLGIEHPIILGPMGGGPSTPELVAAVSNAGGLGSLGAAYLTPDQIGDAICRIRSLTSRPFNVNLFAGGWRGVRAAARIDRDASAGRDGESARRSVG